MKKNGFTLIELLVTLIILGSITIIAIPSFSSISNSIKKSNLENKIIDIELNANKLGEKYKDDIKNKKCEKYNVEILIKRGFLTSESNKDNVIYNSITDKPLNGTIYTCYCETDFKIKSFYTEEFNSENKYIKNEKVFYKDKIYVCINDYPGNNLGIESAYYDKKSDKTITYFQEVNC